MDDKARFHLIAGLIRPSGGLYYHARAWLNGGRWRPFKNELAEWLESWPCPRNELILIGPSAGYTLPTPWLGRFGRITAFDLDPLAGPLFRRRHRTAADFHRVDLFWSEGRLSLRPLSELLERTPGATILFCNVLGQVLLEGRASEEEWAAFLRGLREKLRGRAWASYHDVRSSDGHMAIDHLTAGDWVNGLPVRHMLWRLNSKTQHEIEAVAETAG